MFFYGTLHYYRACRVFLLRRVRLYALYAVGLLTFSLLKMLFDNQPDLTVNLKSVT